MCSLRWHSWWPGTFSDTGCSWRSGNRRTVYRRKAEFHRKAANSRSCHRPARGSTNKSSKGMPLHPGMDPVHPPTSRRQPALRVAVSKSWKAMKASSILGRRWGWNRRPWASTQSLFWPRPSTSSSSNSSSSTRQRGPDPAPMIKPWSQSRTRTRPHRLPTKKKKKRFQCSGIPSFWNNVLFRVLLLPVRMS